MGSFSRDIRTVSGLLFGVVPAFRTRSPRMLAALREPRPSSEAPRPACQEARLGGPCQSERARGIDRSDPDRMESLGESGLLTSRREFLRHSVGTLAYMSSTGSTRHRQPGGTGYLWDPLFLEHDTGAGHPERPERLSAVDRGLRSEPWYGSLLQLEPREASVEELEAVHEPGYIGLVGREVAAGRRELSTGDTVISEASYRIARSAVGAVLEAVDAVMRGQCANAFCAVRPPGHHATQDRGMGFCIFNGVAVAARYAQSAFGVQRVLIADWDVHHGNGTQDIFYEDGSVFYMSTHQWPFYPGTGRAEETGAGTGAGTTMNRPFPAGAGDAQIVGAFRDDLLPVARSFRPELVLISAGFDSRIGDLLGGFRVTDDGFRELTRIMLQIAEFAANGRVISVLEGGYSLEGLASSVRAHVDELVLAGRAGI
jgi:acetoin utilization deacetylase AcuC-like enzyme